MLITALYTTQKPLEFRGKEEVIALLQANFDDNPLKYSDKHKSYGGIRLQEAHSIVCVKLMRYNQANEKDFKIQVREPEEKQLDFRSAEDNKSPHSSAAFMVNNHSEQKRGKLRMVINYKMVNELTIFDDYFHSNEELILNKTLNWKWFSNFDCKLGFYQIMQKDSAKSLTAFRTSQGQYM